jgi:hypothetical protein
MPKRPIRPVRACNDDAIEALNGLHTDWGALPDGGGMAAVVTLLRSGVAIDRETRLLLAELLDLKEGESTWKLVAKRRRRGQPKDDIMLARNIGRKIAARMTDGIGYESALAEIGEEYGINRSRADVCLQSWRRLEKRWAEENDESN